MEYIVQNIRPILLATLGGLGVGLLYLWFVRGGPGPEPVALLVAAVVAEFWLTAILAGALILAPQDRAGPWTMALGSAVVIWIGFVLPALLVTHLSRGLGLGAACADSAQWLAAMVVEAAILQGVGVSKPRG